MISISLCMIVKNEEHTLEKCLSSVKGIPDEIIIVDTGSTDRTKEIAKRWTDNVYDFEWIHDFSAARNASFSYATMDYCFWLDADDILQPEDAAALRVLKSSLDPKIEAVSMKYHAHFDAQGNVISSAHRFRLLKRAKQFRWVGVVHEHLPIPETTHTYRSEIIVTHQKENPQRSSRNLQIYEHYLATGGTLTPHDLFHYGRELIANERYLEAVDSLQQFLASPDISNEIRLFVLNELATCYFYLQDIEQEHQTTLQSFSYHTPQPVFCCRMGEHFLRKQNIEASIFWYHAALQIPVSLSWTADKVPFRTWLPHKQLGLCYETLGNHEQAMYHYHQVLEYLPDDTESKERLQELAASQRSTRT